MDEPQTAKPSTLGKLDGRPKGIHLVTDRNVAIAVRYFDALARKDLASIPLAPDVVLESPVTPRLCGAAVVLEYLEALASLAKTVRTLDFIAEGDKVAVQFELQIADEVIPGFECMEISEGLIKKLRPYFESRALTNGPASKLAPAATASAPAKRTMP